ncbi:substrate-binding domain-containing protein, partial [Thiolapillus sp.]
MHKQKTIRFLITLLSIWIFNQLAFAEEQSASIQIVRLATTTSTENSGLLRSILPEFEATSGYRVHVIAVGTGKALRMGRDGDVDVVLVHARQAEEQFVKEGFGQQRFSVMYNDFVLVGPESDPAQLHSASDASNAFFRIARSGTPFISRGDDSGTHKKELSLWKRARVSTDHEWYREAGQGMGKVLQMADELGAYTLTDRGTWLAFRDKLSLRIMHQGDPLLFNPYGIIAVDPQRHPHVNYSGAMALIEWMTSSDGQSRIAHFRIGGEQLFQPNANTSVIATMSRV